MAAGVNRYQLKYYDIGKNIKLRPFDDLKIKFVRINDNVVILKVNKDEVALKRSMSPYQCAIVDDALYCFLRLNKFADSVVFSVTKRDFATGDREFDKRWMITLDDITLDAVRHRSTYFRDIYQDHDFIVKRKISQLFGGISLFSTEIREDENYRDFYEGITSGSQDNNIRLAVAAYFGYDLIVQYLLDHGAQIHFQDDQALRNAVQGHRLATVKRLVHQGANIHAREDEALRVAANDGQLEMVAFLLENGAYPNAYYGQALKHAAYYDRADIAELLIRYNADIHADNDAPLLDAVSERGVHNTLLLLLGSSYSKKTLEKALKKAKDFRNQEVVNLIQQRIDSGEY